METVAQIIGAIVVIVCVIGFVRSLWRSPGRRGGTSHNEMAGTDMSVPCRYEPSDHGMDSGGHGGGDAGGGHGGST
jgi:hypothetical protein